MIFESPAGEQGALDLGPPHPHTWVIIVFSFLAKPISATTINIFYPFEITQEEQKDKSKLYSF
jgi:hypothetical protein